MSGKEIADPPCPLSQFHCLPPSAGTYLKLSRSRAEGRTVIGADTPILGSCPNRICDLHHEHQIPYGTVSVGIVCDDLLGMNASQYLISRGWRLAQRDWHNQAHPAQACQGHRCREGVKGVMNIIDISRPL